MAIAKKPMRAISTRAFSGLGFSEQDPKPENKSYGLDRETVEQLRPLAWASLVAICLCIYLFTTPACDRIWRACGGDWTRAKELPERQTGARAGIHSPAA